MCVIDFQGAKLAKERGARTSPRDVLRDDAQFVADRTVHEAVQVPRHHRAQDQVVLTACGKEKKSRC